LLGFQSQGFLDAWGPVFFFAMIFAISMDYTSSCSPPRKSTGIAKETRVRR
jgi:RND superfamily putative drug exporter